MKNEASMFILTNLIKYSARNITRITEQEEGIKETKKK